MKRQEAIDLADEWKKRMTEVVSLAPAFGMMSAPAAAIDVTTGAIADRKARNDTSRFFDHTAENGEDAAIGDLQLPDTANERQTVLSRTLVDEARAGRIRLPPVSVTDDGEGALVVASPDDQAMVNALREAGVQRVRVVNATKVAEEARQQAEAEAREAAAGEAAGPTPEEQQAAQEAIDAAVERACDYQGRRRGGARSR